MKRILIFSHALELGGAERSLLGLLEAIDTTEYHVDLFLMRHMGELMGNIPQGIHLLPQIPQYASLAVPIAEVLKRGQLRVAWGRLVGKKKAQKRVAELGIPGDNGVALEYSHKHTLSAMPQINNVEYDLAISFLTPHYFVAEKVTAKKKLAWIHTDYSQVAVDVESELQMWARYDAIASISDNVTESFLQVFPSLRSKVVLIENIMPVRYMNDLVKAFSVEDKMPADGSIRLLSIGRYCTAKNFDNVPDICRRIRETGLNIKWYLIGFGGDEELIRQRIADAGMEEYVIMLGKKENPYPYIKACDLYVQPSRYEGKCVAVREAQMLGKPVVITRYTTSSSQLEDGVDGVIVPMDNGGCAAALVDVLKDIALQEKMVQNAMIRDYSNKDQVQKLYRLMER